MREAGRWALSLSLGLVHEEARTTVSKTRDQIMAEQLIREVQKRTNSEVVILREQVDQTLAYMDDVVNPNVHTLAHIRRLLTGEPTTPVKDTGSGPRRIPMESDTMRVVLPDGVGYVEIRTGNVHGPTGYPVVAAEMVSHSVDTPAADGRLYEPQFNLGQNTIYMVGRPDTKETGA
jgi:hypothetical protein